jgi:tetratricopeptide (TPR) repeat protein
MLTTPFAVLALTFALVTPQGTPQSQEARAEAERLAKSGEHAEALKRFQAIAAANPGDVQARIWIGRLHMEMGESRRAAAVFESIVATEPQNVDALLGLGLAHTASGRTREAADALNRAEAIAADRVDVLIAQGKLHTADARSTLALAYFARASALEPANLDVRRLADGVRAARAHRLDAEYDFQHFNTLRDDTHTGTIEMNVRLEDTFRVFAKGQTHRAFDAWENRGGGGIEWLPRHNIWIRTGALFGSDTIDLPRTNIFGTVVHRGKRAHLGFDLRFVDYEGADLWIGGPTFSFDFTARSTGYLEYHRGNVDFDFGTSSTNDSITLGFKSRIGERASGTIEYRHGLDRLDWLTIDRLASPDANTFSFGVGYDITPFVALGGRYDYSDRLEDTTVQRATVRTIFRF